MSTLLTPNSDAGADAMEAPYRIEVGELDGRCVLKIAGSVDLAAAQTMLAAARSVDGRSGDVVVDWSEADYIHSSSLQLLMSLRDALARRSRSFEIVADSAAVRGFLQLAGLNEQFVRKDGVTQ